jgi:hypothetical protein
MTDRRERLHRALDAAMDYQAEEFKIGESVKVWPAGGKKAWTGKVTKVGPGPELTVENTAWNVSQRVLASQVSKEQ